MSKLKTGLGFVEACQVPPTPDSVNHIFMELKDILILDPPKNTFTQSSRMPLQAWLILHSCFTNSKTTDLPAIVCVLQCTHMLKFSMHVLKFAHDGICLLGTLKNINSFPQNWTFYISAALLSLHPFCRIADISPPKTSDSI